MFLKNLSDTTHKAPAHCEQSGGKTNYNGGIEVVAIIEAGGVWLQSVIVNKLMKALGKNKVYTVDINLGALGRKLTYMCWLNWVKLTKCIQLSLHFTDNNENEFNY